MEWNTKDSMDILKRKLGLSLSMSLRNGHIAVHVKHVVVVVVVVYGECYSAKLCFFDHVLRLTDKHIPFKIKVLITNTDSLSVYYPCHPTLPISLLYLFPALVWSAACIVLALSSPMNCHLSLVCISLIDGKFLVYPYR